jgi:predicted nucleic acid-binding protein
MAMYTFTGANTLMRFRNKIAVADSSYLIALSDVTDSNNTLISTFHHVKSKTVRDFYPLWVKVVGHRFQQLEDAQKLNYLDEGAGYPWNSVGSLIDATGLAPVDAMIVNFAMATGAAAIFSTDCDFAVVADVLDVYVPLEVAQQCAIYDPAID